MENSNHLKAIDQLRGLAILLVLASHAFGYAKVFYPTPFVNQFDLNFSNCIGFLFLNTFANGFLGVLLFFVLSGFCIRWSHLNTSRFSWPDFYKRRFFRIVPAYWLWLVIASYLANAKPIDVIFHGLLLHNFSKEYYHSIYGPFWSIAIEWQIYLLYPIIIFIASRVPQKIILPALAFTGICSSAVATGFFTSLVGTGIFSIFGRLPTALLFSWMMGFYLADSIKSGQRLKPSVFLLVTSVAAGMITYSHPYTCFLASVPWSYAAYQIVLFFLERANSPWFRALDWMAGIGVISYSVYLSHDLFAFVYPYFADWLALPSGNFISGVAALFIMLIPVMLVGYVSYRIIEIPGVSLGKKLRRRKMKPVLLAAENE